MANYNDDELEKHLYRFVKELVKNGESRMTMSLKLICGDIKKTGKNTKKASDILGGASGAVPFVGGLLKELIKSTINKGGEKVHHKKALRLIDVVFDFDDNKELYREKLVRIGVELFQSFEYQFFNITKHGSRDLALLLLAEEAARRLINFIGTNEEYKELMPEFVVATASVLSEYDIFLSTGSSIKYEYDNKFDECQIGDLYENISIIDEERGNICYSADLREALIFGYRRPFFGENLNSVRTDFVIGKRKKINFPLQEYRRNYDFYEKQVDVILEKLKYDYDDLNEKRDIELMLEIKNDVLNLLDLIKKTDDSTTKIDEIIYLVQKIDEKDCVNEIHEYLRQTNENVLESLKQLAHENEINFNELNRKLDYLSINTNQGLKIKSFKSKGIEFGLMEPVKNAIYREDKLNELHKSFQCVIENYSVSHVTVITGLGGVGKTELVKTYISRHRGCYENIIFIRAEKRENVIESFKDLAKKLGISLYDKQYAETYRLVKNDSYIDKRYKQLKIDNKKERDFKLIMQDIFNYFSCNGKTLFVLDNAEEYKHLDEFIPQNFFGQQKPCIIVTSRYKNWNINQEGDIKIIQLEVFQEKEAIDFVIAALEYQENMNEIKVFVETLQYLPLALTHSVAYINQQRNVQNKIENVCNYFKIIDYLTEYAKCSSELLNKGLNDNKDRYNETVMTTWNITVEKIDKDFEERGALAMKIFNIMAYLAPDNIRIKELFNRFDLEKLADAVLLLENYSMINMNNGIASIHRVVQEVSRINLRKFCRAEVVIKETLWLLYNSGFDEHIAVTWEYGSEYKDLVNLYYEKSVYGVDRNKPIHLLVKYGNNLRSVKNICNRKKLEIIEEKNIWGENALHIAASKGSCEMVKFLFTKNRLLAYDRNWNDELPIDLAIIHKHFDVVKILSDKQEIDYTFRMKLLQAIENEDVDKFNILIKNENEKKRYFVIHKSILKLLVYKGKPEMIDTLLKLDLVIERNYLLNEAIIANNFDLLKTLIDKGFDVNSIDKKLFTPLCYSAWEGRNRMTNLLLEAGANVKFENKSRLSPLHCASWNGNINIIDVLIKNGANTNQTNDFGLTPLHCASWNNNVGAVEMLLKNKANIHAKDDDGMTALHYAARSGNVDVVRVLIKNRAKVNCRTQRNITPLHYAARNGNVNIIKILLENKSVVNNLDSNHLNPAHYALKDGNDDVAKILLDRHLDINFQTKDGHALLHFATRNNNVETVQLLLDKKANIDVVSKRGLTPLHNAARNGNLDIVNLLLKSGIGNDVCTDAGYSSFLYACRSGNVELVKVLFDKKLINSQTKRSLTPLHMAAYNGNTNVVMFLLENEPEINAVDKDGFTPLHTALREGNENVAHLLLTCGADAGSISFDGITPLHFAAEYCNEEIVTELLNNVNNVNAVDKKGHSAIYYAASNENSEIIEILLSAGAKLKIFDNEKLSPLHHALLKRNNVTAIKLIENCSDLKFEKRCDKKFIHCASRCCNAETVKLILENGGNANTLDDDDMSPLHYAILGGDIEVVNVLLNHQVDVNKLDCNDMSPLHYALSEYNEEFWMKPTTKCTMDSMKEAPLELRLEIALLLLKNGAWFDTDVNGLSLLHMASTIGSLDIIVFLLENNVNINVSDKQNFTPLLYAFHHDHYDVVEYLLKKGAHANISSINNVTPIHYAAGSGKLDVVKMLMEQNVNIKVKSNNGLYPIHCAAWSGNLDIVKLLHTNDDNEEFMDKQKFTPLHYACRENNIVIIEYLLSVGKNRFLQNKKCTSPLHLASHNGCVKSVEMLLAANAYVDCVDNDGLTPLHCAVRENYKDVVELLLEKNANPNIGSKLLMTPLHYAVRNGNEDIVDLLIEADADVNAKDDQNLCPIHYSVLQCNYIIIDCLLKNNADANARDKNNSTVLHYLFHDDKDKIMEKGAKIVDDLYEESSSTLQCAARDANDNIMLKLLERHTKKATVHENNTTNDERLKVLMLLLESTVDVNATNKYGDTAYHLASAANDNRAVELLKSKNCVVSVRNKRRTMSFSDDDRDDNGDSENEYFGEMSDDDDNGANEYGDNSENNDSDKDDNKSVIHNKPIDVIEINTETGWNCALM